MCFTCYQDYGAPQVITDKVQQATAIMGDPFFPLNSLDEISSGWDLRDDTIEHCRRKARSAEECDVCSLLLRMSMAERATTIAIDQGLIDPAEIDSDFLHNCMEQERIVIQPLVPLFVQGVLYGTHEVVEVSRERARLFIQKGHAKPHPSFEKCENQSMDVPPQTTPKRKRRTRKSTPKED